MEHLSSQNKFYCLFFFFQTFIPLVQVDHLTPLGSGKYCVFMKAFASDLWHKGENRFRNSYPEPSQILDINVRLSFK